MRECKIDDCTNVALARGWCKPHYNRWYYSGSPVIPVGAASCQMCGGELPPKPASGPRASYCSRTCRTRAGTISATKRTIELRRIARDKRPAPVCQWDGCERELPKPERGRDPKWCDAHRAELRRLQPRDNAAKTCAEDGCDRAVRALNICNMHYKRVLSEQGRLKPQPWDDRRRANSQKRRAIKKGVTVEHVSLTAVAERDEYACGICGNPVDRNLAWPDPMSRSLDHIIPLSRGGRHSMDNCQLAHLRCNVSKGARILEPEASHG